MFGFPTGFRTYFRFMRLLSPTFWNVKSFSEHFESSEKFVAGCTTFQTIPTIVGNIEARDNRRTPGYRLLCVAFTDKVRITDYQDRTTRLDYCPWAKFFRWGIRAGIGIQSDFDHALIIPNFRPCQPTSDLFSILF